MARSRNDEAISLVTPVCTAHPSPLPRGSGSATDAEALRFHSGYTGVQTNLSSLLHLRILNLVLDSRDILSTAKDLCGNDEIGDFRARQTSRSARPIALYIGADEDVCRPLNCNLTFCG